MHHRRRRPRQTLSGGGESGRRNGRHPTLFIASKEPNQNGGLLLHKKVCREYPYKQMKLRARLKCWLYGSCPGFSGAFSYFGTRVAFPKGSHIFERACETGIYERDNLKLIAALVRPGTRYMDVGANIGLLSIPLLHYFPTSQVVSFEPSPNALPYLLETQRQSGFGDRWRVIGKAVGSQLGQLEFFAHAPRLGA